MSDKKIIEFGDLGRDKVTGVQGVVVSFTRYLYNCDRVGLQPIPKTNSEKPVEELTFDTYQVDVVKKGKVKFGNVNNEIMVAGLGDLVKDNVTLRTGIVLGICRQAYGSPILLVQPQQLDKDGRVRGILYFNHAQVTVVQSKKIVVENMPEKPVVDGKKTTGGPMPTVKRPY